MGAGLRRICIGIFTAVLIAACAPKPAQDTHLSAVVLKPQAALKMESLLKEARGLTIMVDPEKARIVYKNILEEVQAHYPKNARRTALALNDYGAILNITGTPREALPYHEQAVDIIKNLGQKTDKAADDYARVLANLAETYVRLNAIEKGREIYQKAYDIAPQGLSAHPDDIAKGVYPLLIAANWREFFIQHPENIFITHNFQESKIARDEANRLDRYARAQSLGSDPDGAFKAWMAVLPAMQKAYPPRSRKVLIATGNRGAVLGYFGKNDQAKALQNINIQGSLFYGSEIYEDAVNMSRKLGNLGWARARLNEMNAAEEFFLRDYEIVTKKLPKINEELGEAYRGLTHISNWRGDYARSIQYAIAGLAANRAAFGEKNEYTLDSWLDLARAYSSAGLPKKAEHTAREALAVSLDFLGAGHRTSLYFQLQMGSEMSRQGRYHEAKAVFDEAIAAERRAKGEYRVILVEMLVSAAQNLTSMGRSGSAVLMAEEAAKLAPDVGGIGSQYHTNALMALGGALHSAGQFENALGAFDQALDIYEMQEDAMASQNWRHAIGQKARVLMDAGREEAALGLLADLTKAQRDTGHTGVLYRSDRLLEAFIMATKGQAKAALKIAWPLAQELQQDTTRKLAARTGLAQDAQVYRQGFEHILAIAILAGDEKKSVWAAQQLLRSGASRARTLAAYRAAITDAGLQAQLKDEEDIIGALTLAQTSYAKMATRDPQRARLLSARIDGLEKQLTKVQRALSRSPQGKLRRSDSALSIAQIRSGLESEEAVLIVAEGSKNLYTILITRKDVHMNRALLSAKEIREKVQKLRANLELGGAGARSGIEVSAFDLSAAHTLYQALFPPENEALLSGITHLNIAVNGAFSSLPLSVLVKQPPESIQQADWLIKHYSLATLASLHDVKTRVSVQARTGGFLGIGDPLYSEESGLASLNGSRLEVTTIAQTLNRPNTQLLRGAKATETAVKGIDFNGFDVVLFSTHGFVGGEKFGLEQSALALSTPIKLTQLDDGMLTISEIAQLNIPASWIVLSACNTGAGDSINAPGLSGLAQAFLSAGGRSLLVSHWPVRDDVAAYMVPRTIGYAQATDSRARALQRAALDLMQDATIPNAAHPALWAPFVLVGR